MTRDEIDHIKEEARCLREEVAGLKHTIITLRSDLEAAARWASAYERDHGPFKIMPPDFMIPF